MTGSARSTKACDFPPHICYTRTVVNRYPLLTWRAGAAGLIFLLLAACGYNPNQPAYDTTLNPAGFPPDALTVLRQIQADSLADYVGIANAFGELYASHPELFDNHDWQSVVHKLGASFRYKADQAVSHGFSQYSRAAGLYTLAAFARPNDARSVEQRDLFEVWTRTVEDSLVTEHLFDSGKGPGLSARLRIARAFVFDDSLSGVFANRYLIPPLFYSSPQFNLLNVRVLDSLSAQDRALATLLGLIPKPDRNRLVAFSNPSIDLLSAELIPAGKNSWRAALYFVPKQKIDSNFTVALRLKIANPTAASPGEVSLDFQPLAPTSRWKAGRVAVAYRKFQYSGKPVEVTVGLYDHGTNGSHFVELEGSTETFWLLPPTVFERPK